MLPANFLHEGALSQSKRHLRTWEHKQIKYQPAYVSIRPLISREAGIVAHDYNLILGGRGRRIRSYQQHMGVESSLDCRRSNFTKKGRKLCILVPFLKLVLYQTGGTAVGTLP